MRVRVLATLSLTLVAMAAHATTIHVLPDGSGDAPTIAAAYAMAVSGDDILLAPGTFYEHDIVMKSLVDLRSESDLPSDTIVDAQGLGRCLDGGGLTGAPIIRGITFQNGVHDEEGGILLAGRGGTGGGHNAQYHRCIFRGGSAPIGGAVVTRATGGSAPRFANCAFEDNAASAGSGGAIWSAGVGEVTSCTFRRNQASVSGGAIASEKFYNWGIWVEGCTFEENAANESGGAFFSTGPGETYGTTLRDSHFSENTAANGGAARLNEFDRVTRSTFLDNAATGNGGALWLDAIAPDKDGFGDYNENVFARISPEEREARSTSRRRPCSSCGSRRLCRTMPRRGDICGPSGDRPRSARAFSRSRGREGPRPGRARSPSPVRMCSEMPEGTSWGRSPAASTFRRTSRSIPFSAEPRPTITRWLQGPHASLRCRADAPVPGSALSGKGAKRPRPMSLPEPPGGRSSRLIAERERRRDCASLGPCASPRAACVPSRALCF